MVSAHRLFDGTFVDGSWTLKPTASCFTPAVYLPFQTVTDRFTGRQEAAAHGVNMEFAFTPSAFIESEHI